MVRSPDLDPNVIESRPISAHGGFDEVYHDEYEPMVRLAYLVVGDRETAEEIVQDAFVRAHGRWDELDRPGAYVRTCVVNGCTDHIRRVVRFRRRVPAIEHDATLRHDASLAAADVDGTRPDLVRALAALDARHRVALVLRFYGGFSESEIAESLGVRPGTVKSLVHRGLEKLRQEIEP